MTFLPTNYMKSLTICLPPCALPPTFDCSCTQIGHWATHELFSSLRQPWRPKNAQFLLCWWNSGMSYDEFSHVHHHLITQILRLGYSTLQIMVGWSLPSGKRLHNYGKSPFFMGKFIINYQWWFSIIMLNYQRVFIAWWHTKQCSPPRLNGWTNPGMWSPLADIRPYNVGAQNHHRALGSTINPIATHW